MDSKLITYASSGGYESPSFRSELLLSESGFASSSYSSIAPWDEEDDDDALIF